MTSGATSADYISTPTALITQKALDETNCTLYPPGTLLVAMYGEGKTRGQIAELKIEAATNQACAAIAPICNDAFIPAYVKACFNKYYDSLRDQAKGAQQPNLNLGIISNFHFPLPPLSEQCRIVAAIESAFTVIDEIEAAKNDLQTAIATAKQKILSLAIHGKLVPQDPNDEPAAVLLEHIRAEREQLTKAGKIKRGKAEKAASASEDNSYYAGLPESWAVTSLSAITTSLTLNDGDWILSENMNPVGTVKLVQLGSVGYMEYIDKGFKYLSQATFEELNCTVVSPGYMLINRLLGERLYACLLPEIDGTLITTVDTCWIAPNENYNLRYLMYMISSKDFQTQVFLNSAGSTRKRISKGNLIQLPFPFPPLAEQHRIVTAIEAAFEQLDSIAATIA